MSSPYPPSSLSPFGAPSGQTPGFSPVSDPNELLRRIEKNTADTLYWTKLLVVVAIVLVVVVALLG